MDQQRLSSLEGEVRDGIDVIVKLTQFSGSEKSIVELINTEIKRLNKQHKDCETCQKSLPSSDCGQHKKLEDLQEKLKTLTQNNNNSPRELLNNLCTGLEKFLGYQDGNYTGKGIVYSDLDRLCDGVMSFLHGVLESVKDDESVTTYDKDASNKISSLPEKLAITQVSDALGAWDKELSWRTWTLNDALSTLQNNNVAHFSELLSFLNMSPPDKVAGRLGLCIQEAEKLQQAYKQADTHYNNLDRHLKINLKDAMYRVQLEVDKFVAAASNSGLKAVVEKAGGELSDLKWKVERKVHSAVGTMVDDIVVKFNEQIKAPIKDIRSTLIEVEKDLLKWIEEAGKIIKKVIGKCDAIVAKLEGTTVDGTENPEREAVKTAAGKLYYHAQSLWTAANSAKKLVEKLAADAKQTLTTRATYIEEQLKNIKASVEFKVSEAAKAVELLDDKLNVDMQALKEKISKSVKDYIGKLAEALGKGMGSATGTWKGNARPGVKALQDAVAAWKTTDMAKFGESFGKVLSEATTGGMTGELGQYIEWVLYNLMKVGQHMKSNKPDIVLNELKQSIGDKIEGKFATSFAKIGNYYAFEQYNPQRDTARGKINDVKNADNFNKLDKYDVDVCGADGKKLETKIEDIKLGVQDALNSAIGSIDKPKVLSDALIDVTSALNTFTDAVKNLVNGGSFMDNENNKGAKKLLQDVHQMINNGTWIDEKVKGLTEIKGRIHNLQNGVFAQLFSYADNFYDHVVKDQANLAIKQINEFIEENIHNATETIQDEARNTYYSRISKMLDEMKESINWEITVIDKAIRSDLHTGVKGFLKHFMGNIEISGIPSSEKKLEALTKRENSDPKKGFITLSTALNDYLRPIFTYVIGEVKSVFPNTPAAVGDAMITHPYREEIESVKNAFDALLQHLEVEENIYHFDYDFQNLLAALTDAVNGLSPDKFGATSCNVLDVLKKGMLSFTEQLQTAYVNKYCDQEYVNADGPKYAKLFMSILRGVIVGLEKVNEKCNGSGEWKDYKICEKEGKEKNPLGVFFENSGFKVPPNDGSKQGGELKWKVDWNGKNVFDLFTDSKTGLFKDVSGAYESDVLDRLHALLHNYYSACHLNHIPTPATPTSVYKMLIWLSGFWYNPMYDKVCVYVRDLFDKPKEESKLQDPSSYALDATTLFSATTITDTLSDVCDHAEKTLVAILGFGHAEGEYAVEFTDNSHKLLYPSSPSQCFDTLSEILYRLYHQLNFLFIQCSRTYDANTWRECWYGSGIGGSSWECNKTQCANQECPQKADQKGNQNGNQGGNRLVTQTCDQHPMCGLKSPLQSFLEDGLPGFLPHSFKTPGCKLTCTVSNHRGIPCKTPMGFGDIATTSSHTKTGAHLRDVLREFCGDSESPLTKLCSLLTCLSQRTPQTLDDLFAFYFCYLYGWNDKDMMRKKHQKGAFDESVKKAYFNKQYDDLDVTPMFESSVHGSGDTSSHLKGDLYSLHRCDYEGNSEISCGRYLQPMGMNIWNTFSNKNADKYLSWVVYLTETFYDLLEKLLKECCDNCNKPGTKCYIKSCDVTCKVKAAYESDDTAKDLKNKHHSQDCKSIANCPFTRPTLAKYGFVFQSSYNLSGIYGPEKVRTCRDFCATLKRILNDVEKDEAPLAKLIYRTIPNFLWAIRTPFSYLLLALWSLSLLYLLHIAVVRLDVLRIRSHLRSPSSHRIAAQSLLAAARVRALANVKYFSP
ncbi:hypothetical protein, conserved [Babesia ovata]|uniref:Uncharacterized protein n=1 Tax=Babesia ovata TaxID=189622 RepID=A0A2H6KIX5_9APIC|nr:uncharacterized protein BOVATA_044350 [Babesia ovata]GBE62942.1 hypothetical protein, conserved [Babesia ovata]